jgi:hypothetical protein
MSSDEGGLKMPEMPKIEMPELNLPDKMPESFEEGSAMVVKLLGPVEELSPFKLGQIQKLIEETHEETGKAVAPAFAVGQVLFLLAFVGYFVWGVVVLCLDSAAMDAPCAKESWVWLYALLVIVIPTSLGTVMGCIKGGIAAAGVEDKVPSVILTLPPPVLMVTLAILGIVLWGGMTEECGTFYDTTHAQLIVLFHIQVILMSIAGVFGFLTAWAQTMVLIKQYVPIPGGDSEGSKSV